jgi:hypothetical protein
MKYNFFLINADAENLVSFLSVILGTRQRLKSIGASQKSVAFFPLIVCYADFYKRFLELSGILCSVSLFVKCSCCNFCLGDTFFANIGSHFSIHILP